MTIGIATTHRNARMQVIVDAVDAGSAAGRLRIYKGTRPGTGGTPGAGDLLADLVLPDPCGTVTNGVLTFGTIADQAGSATGSPTWCRFCDSDDNPVLDGDVGAVGSGALVELDGAPIAIYAGGTILIGATKQLTEGNA